MITISLSLTWYFHFYLIYFTFLNFLLIIGMYCFFKFKRRYTDWSKTLKFKFKFFKEQNWFLTSVKYQSPNYSSIFLISDIKIHSQEHKHFDISKKKCKGTYKVVCCKWNILQYFYMQFLSSKPGNISVPANWLLLSEKCRQKPFLVITPKNTHIPHAEDMKIGYWRASNGEGGLSPWSSIVRSLNGNELIFKFTPNKCITLGQTAG